MYYVMYIAEKSVCRFLTGLVCYVIGQLEEDPVATS